METPPKAGELGTSPSQTTTPAPDSFEEKKANIEKEATSVSTAQPQDHDLDQDQDQDVDPVLERWNSSSINVTRYLQTLLAFLVMGVSDASLGVSVLHVIIYIIYTNSQSEGFTPIRKIRCPAPLLDLQKS